METRIRRTAWNIKNITIIIIGPSEHSGLDQKHLGIQPRKPRLNDATVSVWKCVHVNVCVWDNSIPWVTEPCKQSPDCLCVACLCFPVLCVRNGVCSSTDRRSAFLPQLAAGWVIVYRPFHSAILSNDGDATFPLNHNFCMSLHDTKLGLRFLYKRRHSLSLTGLSTILFVLWNRSLVFLPAAVQYCRNTAITWEHVKHFRRWRRISTKWKCNISNRQFFFSVIKTY